MHELAEVWTRKRGLAWIAVTAILYALVLIPFNQVHWDIAGIPIRPAAALTVVFGILCGPAAAWGFGIGNIAGDLSGSWSLMSIIGFLINVLYPYVSYRLWHRLMRGHELRVDKFSLGRFFLVTFVATLVCMALLALGGTVFFGRPFESKFIGYFANNIIWAMLAGPVVFCLIFDRAVRNGWVYGREWDRLKQSLPLQYS